MRHRTTLVSAALTAVVTVLVAACADATGPSTRGLSPGGPSLDVAPKVTICHAAGLAGTTKYVEITISGNAGDTPHLNDNGTPKAGHEQDFLVTESRLCLSGQIQVCVTTSSPSGTDHSIPIYDVTVTASGGGPTVLSQQFLYSASTQCTAETAVAPGTYTANHPAPGLPETSPPNGDWFTTNVVVNPAENGISALPALGTSWDSATGRGEDSWATVKVVKNGLTVVTFNNTL
jgi:hypothetical protein